MCITERRADGRRWMDVEEGTENEEIYLMFQDKIVRLLFVRKVYMLLSLNLLYLTAMTLLFVIFEPIQRFLWETPAFTFSVLGIGIFSLIVIMFIMCCCSYILRIFPLNYCILFFFTISVGTLVAILSSIYEVEEVFMALGITCLIVFAATLFACQTRFDFTTCVGVLLALCVGLMVLSLAAIFSRNKIVNIVYAACGAVVATIFLVVDTQLVMGGRRREISPEDYVLATIILYTDIVRLFLFLLQLIGLARR